MNGLGYTPVCSSSALSKKNAAVIPKQFDLAKVWDRAVFSFY